jgi:hypothetical protein
MRTIFVSGLQHPSRTFFMGDFWDTLVDQIPTAIERGTDIYLRRQQEEIEEEKRRAKEAAAAAALAVERTARIQVGGEKILGIDKTAFIVGAVGLGLVGIITTVALTR